MGPYRCPVRFFVTYLDSYGALKTLGLLDRKGTADLIRRCRGAGDPVVSVEEVLFSGEKVCRWQSRLYEVPA